MSRTRVRTGALRMNRDRCKERENQLLSAMPPDVAQQVAVHDGRMAIALRSGIVRLFEMAP